MGFLLCRKNSRNLQLKIKNKKIKNKKIKKLKNLIVIFNSGFCI